MKPEPIKLDGNDKLRWLRRLDGARSWDFLDEERCCSCCGKSFTGRQVRLVGGSRPLGPLVALCPTQACESTPSDWIYLHELPAKAIRAPRFRTPRAVRLTLKGPAHSLGGFSSPASLPRYAVLRAGFRVLSHVGVVT